MVIMNWPLKTFWLLSISVISGGQNEKIFNEGSDVELQCKGAPGNTCIWTIEYEDGNMEVLVTSNRVIIHDRYVLNDSPTLGDCTLKITNVQTSDEGKLTCIIRPHSTAVNWDLVVLSRPHDPQIEYNNMILTDDKITEIETPAEIKCIVEGKKPDPDVIWEHENPYEFKVTKETKEEKEKVINTLIVDFTPNEIKPEKTLICLARHPRYPYEKQQKTVTVIVGKKYPTQSISIYENKILHVASCSGDGIPRPNIQWKYRKGETEEWEDISIDKNISIRLPGSYKCLGGNDVNGGQWLESKVIQSKGDERAVKYVSISANKALVGEVISCQADGYSPHEYLWTILFPHQSDEKNISIKQNISLSQPGIYHCEARNEHNEKAFWISSSNVVKIELFENVSSVKIKMEWDEATLGDTITCEANGNPPHSYKWNFKKHLDLNWTLLGSGKKIILLYIGLYYCEARNKKEWVRSTNRIFIRKE